MVDVLLFNDIKKETFDKLTIGNNMQYYIESKCYDMYNIDNFEIITNIEDIDTFRNFDKNDNRLILSGNFLTMSVKGNFSVDKDILIIDGVPHPLLDAVLYKENDHIYVWYKRLQTVTPSIIDVFSPKGGYTKELLETETLLVDDDSYAMIVRVSRVNASSFRWIIDDEYDTYRQSSNRNHSVFRYYVLTTGIKHILINYVENSFQKDNTLKYIYHDIGFASFNGIQRLTEKNETISMTKYIITQSSHTLGVHYPVIEDKYGINSYKEFLLEMKDIILPLLSTKIFQCRDEVERINNMVLYYQRETDEFKNAVKSLFTYDSALYDDITNNDNPMMYAFENSDVTLRYDLAHIQSIGNLVNYLYPVYEIQFNSERNGPFEIYINDKFFHGKVIQIDCNDEHYLQIGIQSIIGTDIISSLKEKFPNLPVAYNRHYREDISEYLSYPEVIAAIESYIENITVVHKKDGYKRYDTTFTSDMNNIVYTPNTSLLSQVSVFCDGLLMTKDIDYVEETIGGLYAIVFFRIFDKPLTHVSITYVVTDIDSDASFTTQSIPYSIDFIDSLTIPKHYDNIYLNGAFIRYKDLFFMNANKFLPRVESDTNNVDDDVYHVQENIDKSLYGTIDTSNDKRELITTALDIEDDIKTEILSSRRTVIGRPEAYIKSNVYKYIFFFKYVLFQEIEERRVYPSDPYPDFTNEEIAMFESWGIYINGTHDISYGGSDVYPSYITTDGAGYNYLPNLNNIIKLKDFYNRLNDAQKSCPITVVNCNDYGDVPEFGDPGKIYHVVLDGTNWEWNSSFTVDPVNGQWREIDFIFDTHINLDVGIT